MHPHLRLHQSRLSNSPVVEQLINTADEAVEIKENREDKGHTGDLRMRNKKKKDKTPERQCPAMKRQMSHAVTVTLCTH